MRGILIDSGKSPEIRNVPDTVQALAALNWPLVLALVVAENALIGAVMK